MKRVFVAVLACAVAALQACGGTERKAAEASPLQFEAPADPKMSPAAATLRHGERLAAVLGCSGCHGKDLTGHAWSEDPREAILFTSNLTRAVPDYDDKALERAIREGVRNDGSPLWVMPSDIFTHLSAADMAALIAHLRRIAPKGEPHPRIRIGPEGRRMIAAGEIKPADAMAREHRDVAPPRLDGRHDWARYMVRATCSECHGLELKGDPPGETEPSPDLAVAGTYSREEFRRLLRTGKPTGGRKLGLMEEVALGRFVHLTDREVDAIHDYLKARALQPN